MSMAELCDWEASCEVRRLAETKPEKPLYPTLKWSDFILRATDGSSRNNAEFTVEHGVEMSKAEGNHLIYQKPKPWE